MPCGRARRRTAKGTSPDADGDHVTSGLPHAVRILAGAPAEAHTRIARPGSSNRWFEPTHIREPARVRDEMADQVVAGATILVAPTWLTHRRALVPVGETRRGAGVDIARGRAGTRGQRHRRASVAARVRAISILGVLPDPDAHRRGGHRAAAPSPMRPRNATSGHRRASWPRPALTAWSSRHGHRSTGHAWRSGPSSSTAWTRGSRSPVRGRTVCRSRAWLDALAADGVDMMLFETLDGAPDERPPEGPFGLLITRPSGRARSPGRGHHLDRARRERHRASPRTPPRRHCDRWWRRATRPLAAAAQSAARQHAELGRMDRGRGATRSRWTRTLGRASASKPAPAASNGRSVAAGRDWRPCPPAPGGCRSARRTSTRGTAPDSWSAAASWRASRTTPTRSSRMARAAGLRLDQVSPGHHRGVALPRPPRGLTGRATPCGAPAPGRDPRRAPAAWAVSPSGPSG